jgi:nitrile hydratase accessory protein
LALTLNEGGLFSWTEWAEALSDELKGPNVASDGRDYYSCWLRALEKLITARGVAAVDEIDALAASWQRAAHATPHGKPILLENDPQRNNAKHAGVALLCKSEDVAGTDLA